MVQEQNTYRVHGRVDGKKLVAGNSSSFSVAKGE